MFSTDMQYDQQVSITCVYQVAPSSSSSSFWLLRCGRLLPVQPLLHFSQDLRESLVALVKNPAKRFQKTSLMYSRASQWTALNTIAIIDWRCVETRLRVYVINFPAHCAGINIMSPHYNLYPAVKIYRRHRRMRSKSVSKNTTDLICLLLLPAHQSFWQSRYCFSLVCPCVCVSVCMSVRARLRNYWSEISVTCSNM